MITIDKNLMDDLFVKANESEKKRINFDMRTSEEDSSQRMLNALTPGTVVPIHRHPRSTESIICISGDLDVIVYEEEVSSESDKAFPRSEFSAEVMRKRTLVEKERIHLCPDFLTYGCTVPKDTWHTVEVHLPSLIFEAKDGKYGEDGSESWGCSNDKKEQTSSVPDNCIGDLKQQITYLIGMERHSGSMDNCSPLYISRMLNVPLEEVEKAMKEMQI